MELKYRGIAYDIPSTVQLSSPEKVEGRYHGLATQISLPQVSERLDDVLALMMYRGIQLASR